MGYIRLLLASSVLIGHAWPVFPPRAYEFAGGVVSVRLFYMISGFLIALVLQKKYNSALNFYKSRLLRILPTYQIVLILTVLISALSYVLKKEPFLLGYFIGHASSLSYSELIFLCAPQATTFAIDLFGFIGINENGLFLAQQSWKYINGYQFLLIPQAWTLGLECWFYLIAPFIVKRTPWLIILFGLSLTSSYLLSNLIEFSNDDPWARRFFPSELKYFLAGALSFKLQHKLPDFVTKFPLIIFILSTLSICLLDFIPNPSYSLLVYLFFFISLPSLLKSSSRLPLDRFIGDLSYPLYLSHWLFIHAVSNNFLPSFNHPKISSFIYSIFFSLIIVKSVERRIDKIRNKYESQY